MLLTHVSVISDVHLASEHIIKHTITLATNKNIKQQCKGDKCNTK